MQTKANILNYFSEIKDPRIERKKRHKLIDIFVIALKGNQASLYEDVKLYFDDTKAKDFKNSFHDNYKTVEKDHGRIEMRKYWITADVQWLNERHNWEGLNSIWYGRSNTPAKWKNFN